MTDLMLMNQLKVNKQGGVDMAGFIADRIMEAADKSLAKGQAKYRSYFVKTQMYARFKADVDHILLVDDYDDCIVDK